MGMLTVCEVSEEASAVRVCSLFVFGSLVVRGGVKLRLTFNLGLTSIFLKSSASQR